MIKYLRFSYYALCLLPFNLHAQDPFNGLAHLFTEPLHYIATYTQTPPVIDGHINDEAWAGASWSALFTDIEDAKRIAPAYATRFKMKWDNHFLYIAAEITEPHIWANLKKHDQVVFNDNDFEVFIDPDNNTHQYFEIEANAINTIFDLFMTMPYRNGAGPLISWDAPGMHTAVKVQGKLNKSSRIDQGWTLEMAIPYAALTIGNQPKIPTTDDLWRINFSRVEWDTEVIHHKYVKKKDAAGKNLPEHNWVWSPQGVVNMHYPERWGYLQFSKQTDANGLPVFQLPYAEKQKAYLWLVYYRQKEFQEKNGRYAATLAELAIPESFILEGINNKMEMTGSKSQFDLRISTPQHSMLSINQDGFVQY